MVLDRDSPQTNATYTDFTFREHRKSRSSPRSYVAASLSSSRYVVSFLLHRLTTQNFVHYCTFLHMLFCYPYRIFWSSYTNAECLLINFHHMPIDMIFLFNISLLFLIDRTNN